MKKNRHTAEKLNRLMTVVDITNRKDMANLAAATSRAEKIETQIDKLRTQLHAPWNNDAGSPSMHVTAKHRVWIERCLRGLNLKLANAIVERDTVRAALALSTGRKEALAILIEKSSKNLAG